MKTVFVIATAALGLGACVPATPYYLVAPSDPSIPGRGARYATVTAGVKNYAPVGPKDWREMNREVAPQNSSHGAGARHGR